MAVIVGSARIDERGKATGGQAGDQTGKELSTQNWYLHAKGWVALRPKDSAKAARIAQAMRAACANNRIGYDQAQRNTLYNAAKPYGYDPGKVTTACETDCSALVRVCCAYAGIIVGDYNTATQASVLMASGAFVRLDESKYTTKPDYLKTGDILVTKTQGHTVVVLTDGPKAAADPAPAEPAVAMHGIRITGNKVNLRTGPGTDYATVKEATLGEVYADANPDKWYAVHYGNAIAWVSDKYGKRV